MQYYIWFKYSLSFNGFCGHTFCKRCLDLKSSNLDKNVNKSCPFIKVKNVKNIDSAISNLKLESIIKK